MCRAPTAPKPTLIAPRAAQAPAPPLPRPALACSCLSTSRRRHPSRHAPRRLPAPTLAHPCLLLGLKHVLELPMDSLLRSHKCISIEFLFPDHHTPPEHRRCLGSPSTAAAAASHPRSSAPRAPPQPTEAHKPAQFRSLAPERPDRCAGELELLPPLDLAVVPSIHRLLAPAKHTTSTTSSHRSYLATSPPPSGTSATETPTPPLEAPPPVSVRRRPAARPFSSPTPATPVTAVSP
jgi:hypothetical protein